MKRNILLSVVLVIMTLVLLLGSPAQGAVEVSLSITCVDHSQPDRAIIHFGYFASKTIEGTGYFGPVGNFAGDLPPNTLQAGQHDDVFTVEVYGPAVWQFVTSDNPLYELWVDVDTSGPDCDAVKSPYGPDGGLNEITKAVAPGCYEWSIEDNYGHWSTVATTCSQSEGDQVFVRLVLGRDNAVTDPDRYRVWRVDE